MFYKRNSGIWVKVILFYILISLLTDTAILRLNQGNENGENDRALYNVLSAFTLVEFSAFSIFLYKAIESLLFRRIILISAIGFYIFAIGSYIDFIGRTGNSFDSFSASIEAILIVLYSILYLFDQLNKPQVLFIYQEPHFWFVVGFILYLSGTLFLFSQASNLDYEQRQDYWTINLFLNITKNILFAVAFSTRKSKPLNYNSENPFDTYP